MGPRNYCPPAIGHAHRGAGNCALNPHHPQPRHNPHPPAPGVPTHRAARMGTRTTHPHPRWYTAACGPGPLYPLHTPVLS
ncbi:hypothetical protein GCM10010250_29200 [Streptomyces althioticus]|nr:hypothetical protein GCM10010250_29200 [Streptomyces althioticus]